MKLYGEKLIIDTSKMTICDLCGAKKTDKPVQIYKFKLEGDKGDDETDELELCLDCKKKIIPLIQTCLRNREKVHNIVGMNAAIFELLKEILM
jgi:hypothetical protein